MATLRMSSRYITDDADWRTNLVPLVSELTGITEVIAPDGYWWIVPKAAAYSDYSNRPFAGDSGVDKGLLHDIVVPCTHV